MIPLAIAKEKLIKLIKEAKKNEAFDAFMATIDPMMDMPRGDEYLVFHLLTNGVICPPCKVGDKVYSIIKRLDHEKDNFISEETVTEVGSRGFWLSAFVPASDDMSNFEKWESLGKTVFLTREDAEKNLEK